MSINYENVYKLTDWESAIFAAERKVVEAKKKVDEARNNYKTQCAQVVGCKVEDLLFEDSAACIAKGISRHVYYLKDKGYGYTNKGYTNKSAQNKCIFCGCDNAEDFY